MAAGRNFFKKGLTYYLFCGIVYITKGDKDMNKTMYIIVDMDTNTVQVTTSNIKFAIRYCHKYGTQKKLKIYTQK